MIKPKLFYIQNRGYNGNCLLWWRVDGHGYTVNLDDAWKVTPEQADRITRSRPEQDIAWPVEDIDSLAARHVSCESGFRRLEASRKASRLHVSASETV